MANVAPIPRRTDGLELAGLTVDQVRVILGVSKPTLYKLMAEGRLRSIKLGRRRIIPATEIDRLLADDAAG